MEQDQIGGDRTQHGPLGRETAGVLRWHSKGWASMTVEAIGEMVRRVRLERNYSQQQFADLAGVGRRLVSDVENGKPTSEIGKVLQVLTALGIDFTLGER